MTSVFILLILQCCCVSGYDFKPLVHAALRVSVDEMNRQSKSYNLLRATSRVVRQITLVGDDSYDILLDFGTKQTVCVKYHRRTLPESCAFKRGSFTFVGLCSSLVRVGSKLVAPLKIRCIADSTSLRSSSDKIITGRALLDSFCPGVILCQGAVDCYRLLM